MAKRDIVVYWANRYVAEERLLWPAAAPKPFDIIFMCLQGAIRIPLDGQNHELKSGQALIFRADRLSGHVYADTLPVEYQWTSFYYGRMEAMPLRPDRTSSEDMVIFFDRLIAAFQESGAMSERTAFWMEAMLQALEEDHLPPRAQPSLQAREIVQHIVQQVDAHPELFWSAAQLAARAGYSPTHFNRTFRKLTGQSPQQYLIDARIRRAESLLRQSRMTISEIAAQLGYQDVYHFSKQFRQKTGQTPGRIRRS
ncbi:MAG: AraC family transcriptional regulator [Candidatus Sumerlaeia bacterium]